ncbi:hypothetical protein D3C87_1171350 [compost metagenome]
MVVSTTINWNTIVKEREMRWFLKPSVVPNGRLVLLSPHVLLGTLLVIAVLM